MSYDEAVKRMRRYRLIEKWLLWSLLGLPMLLFLQIGIAYFLIIYLLFIIAGVWAHFQRTRFGRIAQTIHEHTDP